MNKTELENAIKNGESVWCIYFKTVIYEFKAKNIQKISKGVIEYLDKDKDFYLEVNLIDIYKTKAEAEHYLHHANITRTETLPFLAWEDFKSGKNITFKAKNGHEFLLKAKQESIYLWWLDTNNIWKTWDLTEANFYKAYDECVKLFRGETND